MSTTIETEEIIALRDAIWTLIDQRSEYAIERGTGSKEITKAENLLNDLLKREMLPRGQQKGVPVAS